MYSAFFFGKRITINAYELSIKFKDNSWIIHDNSCLRKNGKRKSVEVIFYT